jgi:FkbM family methyltransferase
MQRIVSRIVSRWTAAKWAFLRATRHTVTVQTKQGLLTVSTRDRVIGRRLFRRGQYQHDLTQRSVSFLRERGLLPPRGEGVVLDVGANIGVISVGLLFNGEFEAAIGIEPDPTNFALCKQNVLQNDLADRFTALQMAASDRTETLQLELSPDHFGDHRVRSPVDGNACTPAAFNAGRASITVEARPIDDILDSLPSPLTDKISLVWIDVQGHEGYAFAGGSRLFSGRAPVVAEIWPSGIKQSGMGLQRFCEIASGYWSHYWLWQECGRHAQYPISRLMNLCEELEKRSAFDDIILVKN